MPLKMSCRFVFSFLFTCLFLHAASAQIHSEHPSSVKKAGAVQFCDLVLDLGPDVLLCTDSVMTFNAGAGFAKYLWQDGSSGSSFQAALPGIYWVEVTDTCGNIQWDSVRLSFSLIAETHFPDTVICPEEWVHYSAPGFDTYAWAPAAGLSCTDCAAVTIQPKVSTQYTLQASNGMGCVVQDTFTVAIRPLPGRTDTIRFCPGDTVVISGNIYTEAGNIVDKINVPGACDTLVTYVLLQLPRPKRIEKVLVAAGQSVTIGGTVYSQPGTLVLTAPSTTGGCDSLITYVIEIDPVVPDTCVQSDAFLKRYGAPNTTERGYSMCAAADGNLYIAGVQSFPNSLLLKVTPSGKLLWSRTLNVFPLEYFHIVQLIEDSEGSLVACGNFSEGDNVRKTGVFRYDPLADSILWLKVIAKEAPAVFGILELAPGGNYLLNISPQLTLNVNDAELWELDRTTGDLAGGLTRRYSLGSADEFTAMVLHDGFLYTTGRFTTSPAAVPLPVEKMRHALTKIDRGTGTPVWSRLSHLDTSAQAFLYGMDLIVDDGALISVYRGFETLAAGSAQVFFMQKTSLDGDLIWSKRYDLPNSQAEEVVAVSDGYVLYGEAQLGGGDWNLFILKTDKNGMPLWAKRIPDAYPFSASYNDSKQSELLVIGGKLFALASSSVGSDILLLKLDMADTLSGDCGLLLPFQVPVTTLLNPVNTPVQLEYSQHLGAWSDTTATTLAIDLPERTYCVCCAKPCIPQPSVVTVQCPADISVSIPANATSAAVVYMPVQGATDCPCGEATPTLLQGLVSGALFPAGQTTVCYRASDGCGNSGSCCFTVAVTQEPVAEEPCDIKITPCVKFELLDIFQNPAKQRTYRMRVTNTCANHLDYVAFQLPDGVSADQPAPGAVYTAPGGHTYAVRNPNYTPFHSIRFKTSGTGLVAGQSDVFEYTLPPQADPQYIHAVARLEPQSFYESHLNVFDCTVQQTPNKPAAAIAQRQTDWNPDRQGRLSVHPNPATNLLAVDLSAWPGQRLDLHIFDAYGRLLLEQTIPGGAKEYPVYLLSSWPTGVYTIGVVGENGERQQARFIRSGF